MKVCMFVDFMGGGGRTPEDEYGEIEDMFRMMVPGGLFFERDIQPYDLKNRPCDVYVFDFGGLLPGCDSLIESQYRVLIQAIEDRPNTLFVIWSTFSGRIYKEFVEAEFPEHKNFNVVIPGFLTDELEDRLKELPSYPKNISQKKKKGKIRTPSRGSV